MIAVLQDGFVEYLPPILGPIIQDIKADNAIETIQLINQLLSKYKSKMAPIMPEIMMPIFTKLTSNMPQVNHANQVKFLQQMNNNQGNHCSVDLYCFYKIFY